MRRIVIPLLAIALLAACQKVPELSVAKAELVTAVRCGNLIDGLAEEALGARLVVITGERITAVLPDDSKPPVNAKIIDLRDYTCLPGLIDMHVHIDGLPEDLNDYTVFLRRTPEETRELAGQIAGTVLNSGFTSIRHVGAYLGWVDRDVRERIEAGDIVGPRIQVAGPYLTIPHGGGDMYIPGVADEDVPAYYRLGVARGAEEFRARAEEVVAGGADFIKVIASGAVFGYGGIPGAPEMTREEIAAVVEVAHAAGIKVTAHAHGAESIKDAILAGVDSIEHASLADDEAIALAAEHGVAFSMDVYNGTYTENVGREQGYAEEFMRKNEETTEAQRIVFEKALKAGVTILFGTDLGVLPHDMGARQFSVMVRRGMKPMQAIKSATSAAADHMGLADDIGAVAPGRYADLIAVRGNPLSDITVLQDVDAVIKGGTVVKKATPLKPKFADTVYHTGKIYTVNPEKPWAQAVAIRNGRIAFVGTDDGVRSHIGPDTVVYDLRHRLMLPAFQDAHIHPIGSGIEASSCNLNGLDDVALYRSRISEYATANPDVPWILGGGWSMAEFGPGASPSREILDELVPDRPVYLTSQDGHSGWANSVALKIAGITRNTPNPSDGIVDKDPETGEPIGSLQEGAMSLVTKHIPETTLEDRLNGLAYARDMLHSYGITSIQDAYVFEDDLEAYTQIDAAGDLNLRVVAALWWERNETEEQIPYLVELREKYNKGNIRPTTVKIMQDGVMENYTAVMLEPYLTEDGTRGIPMVDPEFLKEAVSLLDAEGFQVHFHAIGDGAVRQSLDAVEEAHRRNGDLGHRHHIAHLQIIDPADVPRFAALGVIANFQPLWAYADDYVVDLTLPFISEETANSMYPIKSVIAWGGKVAFGSDWSVSTANPFPQIETAITRVDAESHATEVMNPEQRISVQQAIEAFTINAAFVNGQEDTTGSIEKGKLADLIVVDRNLLEIDASEISAANVLLTLFEGQPVYGDPGSL
ncbi:MAG: amidohydrolase family protein [Woeseiaceae bacterium]